MQLSPALHRSRLETWRFVVIGDARVAIIQIEQSRAPARAGVLFLLLLMTSVMSVLLWWHNRTGAEPSLRVALIPADGGTETGTIADYRPVFNVVARTTGHEFDLKVASTYGAAVEALCAGKAEIAFLGPATYVQAHERGCARLLAVGVKQGSASYHAVLIVRAQGPIRTVSDIRGGRLAVGDINSASSFLYPMSMIEAHGIDPVGDLSAVFVTGSHSSSLNALLARRADMAGMSVESLEKALRAGAVSRDDIRIVAMSEPIPYPPLVVSTRMSDTLVKELKQAFGSIGKRSDIPKGLIRGYGGEQLDGYSVSQGDDAYAGVARRLKRFDRDLKPQILAKAGRQAQ